MAKLRYLLILLLIFQFKFLKAQDVSQNELQVKMNAYFDNFNVIVLFPSVSITKNLSSSTSINGRYTTDIISAASMRANFQVDGITSATTKKTGGADNTPDEWRHEFGSGITQKLFEGKLSLNGSYSFEHDYSSKTIVGSISYPFAKKNTELQFSVLKSFDKVFPQTRTWTKDRNKLNVNGGLSQVLSKTIISQIDFSYFNIKGYQLDGYQVVQIIQDNTIKTYESVEPESRIERALGIRTNFSLSKELSMQLGYRYYWDTWSIRSNTISARFSNQFSNLLYAGVEVRYYTQTKAFFFKPEYQSVEQYMTVDGKLNSGYSAQVSFDFRLKGDRHKPRLLILTNENLELTGSFTFYLRHTDSLDWFTRYLNMYAYITSLGIRYHF